jgi:hypothetical protein
MNSDTNRNTGTRNLPVSKRYLAALLLGVIIVPAWSGAVQSQKPADTRASHARATPGKVYTIHIRATRVGIEPALIVVLPGTKVNIVFANETGKPTNLLFELPQSTTMLYPEDVPNGQQSSRTLLTPDLERAYYFYTMAHKAMTKGSHTKKMVGTCIVTSGTRDTAKPGKYRDIVMIAREFHFAPSAPVAYPTERLRFTLVNDGKEPHNFAVVLGGKPVSFPTPLAPGEVRSLATSAPAEMGKHAFYDPLGDNRTKGMQGALDVRQ